MKRDLDGERNARKVMANVICKHMARETSTVGRLQQLHRIGDAERRIHLANRIRANAEANTAMGFVYGEWLRGLSHAVMGGAR